MKPFNPQRIIKIEVIVMAEDEDDGVYQWTWGHELDCPYEHSAFTLRKELKKHMSGKENDLLDYLYNFRRVFINLDSGEFHS